MLRAKFRSWRAKAAVLSYPLPKVIQSSFSLCRYFEAFQPIDALADAREAVAYYSARVPQLGAEFIAEGRRIVAWAAARPELGAPMRSSRRRWLFSRFPFALVYRIAPDGSLRVLAVAHHKRRPGYWRGRK